MKGFITNIEKDSLENTDFRRVVYTSKNMQLVLMSLLPLEEIGEEVHTLDQFVRIEKGKGKAYLNDIEHDLEDGTVVIVPAGTKHNFINTSQAEDMKLYTLYAPPDHVDGTIHITRADALAGDPPFDGKTTE
jgi:mannose-6-phosphate isomerase-like protein (cupin superfamily)